MNRETAIQITLNALNKLTCTIAHQIFVEECECQIDMLNTYIWNKYEVGGWQYTNGISCFDNLKNAYLEKALNTYRI
jgi:hypothetical protein